MSNRIWIFALPLAIGAQSTPAVADEFQQWVGYSAKIKLSEELELQNETQVRFSDERGGLYQVQSSLLLGYKIRPNTTIAAGYLHSPNYAAGDFVSMERRLREQISFDRIGEIGKAVIGGRLRFEQRWRDDRPGTAWRMRTQVKLTVPLGGKKDPSLVLSEEAFINLNSTSFQNQDGLERFRTSGLVTLPLSRSVKLEGGYINQHRFVDGGPDTGEHVLSAALNFAF